MREGEQLLGGREFAGHGCSATRGEEGECLRVGDSRFSFPFRSQLWVECARRHGLTVLPPHSKNN